jgi:hypothetical protein
MDELEDAPESLNRARRVSQGCDVIPPQHMRVYAKLPRFGPGKRVARGGRQPEWDSIVPTLQITTVNPPRREFSGL